MFLWYTKHSYSLRDCRTDENGQAPEAKRLLRERRHRCFVEVNAVNEKWSKGEPVSLKDLLRITPLVQELMQVSEDLDVGIPDLIWLIRKMAEDAKALPDLGDMDLEEFLDPKRLGEELFGADEEEDEMHEMDDDEDEPVDYTVNVRISGSDRFPEVSFRAGIADKADPTYFFEWLTDMIDKLE